MGLYINEINGQPAPSIGKASFIKKQIPASEVILAPAAFRQDLVCIVNNGFFEAAAYCFSQNEMEDFAYPCGRQKTWMVVPGVKSFAK